MPNPESTLWDGTSTENEDEEGSGTQKGIILTLLSQAESIVAVIIERMGEDRRSERGERQTMMNDDEQ